MIRLLVILLLLFTWPCYAQDYIPGSYRIEYGGLYKLLADESSRLISNQWYDQEFNLYNNGDMTYCELVNRNIDMFNHVNDWRNGPPWWTRNWWDSFETHRGGAPPNGSILVTVGRQQIILTTPLFSLSNSFDLRWKSLEAAVDFKAEQPINIGIGAVPTPRIGWKFRVSPEISFSPSRVLNNPSEAVRRVGIRLIATHFVKKPIVSVELKAWRNFDDNETYIGVLITLLQW